MAIATGFIVDFLRRHENLPPHFKPLLTGYVPNNRGVAIGQSGVTIATGCDLGQQTPESLLAMGVRDDVVSRLIPYCGLRKEAAIAKLSNLPLVISEDEADAIDAAVIGSYVREVQKRFDLASAVSFADSPKEVQAAVVSLRYQLGFGGFPKTWRMIVSGDYRGAIAELGDPDCWGGNYMSRRSDEADLLEKAVA